MKPEQLFIRMTFEERHSGVAPRSAGCTVRQWVAVGLARPGYARRLVTESRPTCRQRPPVFELRGHFR
jgi:hypothetical protein